LRAEGPGGKLLEGAEGDAVSLAQGAVDGAGFGHAHLGVVEDEGGDIAGMGIAVTDEAAALGGFVDGGFEDPEVPFGVTECENRAALNPHTSLLHRDSQQICVCYVRHRYPMQFRTGSLALTRYPLLVHMPSLR
jgi:hypothetical protein